MDGEGWEIEYYVAWDSVSAGHRTDRGIVQAIAGCGAGTDAGSARLTRTLAVGEDYGKQDSSPGGNYAAGKG